jgi:tRNA threonylcarbamoyladenosine biosynthesis protein TsaB
MAAMNVLAVDTSSHVGTVAVLSGGVLLAELHARVRATHGESLLQYVAHVLDAAGLPLDAIDLFAVGLGPGSFTGVRIGLATAKGLALAEQKPIVGVGSLAVLACAAALPDATVAVALDAYKTEVYGAAYRLVDGALSECVAPFHAPPHEAARLLAAARGQGTLTLVGNATARYGDAFTGGLGPHVQLGPVFDTPRAAFLAHEAERVYTLGGGHDLAALEPSYVRPSDAKLPSS